MGRWLAAILPVLAVLACPLMLLLCLRAMRRHDSHQQATTTTSAHSLLDSPPGATAERLATLERELAELRADRDRAVGQPRPSAGPAAAPAPPGRAGAER
jgi:hypothetical protein